MLDLRGRGIGPDGAQVRAAALGAGTAIYGAGTTIAPALRAGTLYLSDNFVGPEGAQALAEAVRAGTTLKTLDLSGNSIGPEGAQALAEALRANTTLKTLELGVNGIGDALLDAISGLLEHGKARRLASRRASRLASRLAAELVVPRLSLPPRVRAAVQLCLAPAEAVARFRLHAPAPVGTPPASPLEARAAEA